MDFWGDIHCSWRNRDIILFEVCCHCATKHLDVLFRRKKWVEFVIGLQETSFNELTLFWHTKRFITSNEFEDDKCKNMISCSKFGVRIVITGNCCNTFVLLVLSYKWFIRMSIVFMVRHLRCHHLIIPLNLNTQSMFAIISENYVICNTIINLTYIIHCCLIRRHSNLFQPLFIYRKLICIRWCYSFSIANDCYTKKRCISINLLMATSHNIADDIVRWIINRILEKKIRTRKTEMYPLSMKQSCFLSFNINASKCWLSA